jgi:hypothetical protein
MTSPQSALRAHPPRVSRSADRTRSMR